MTLRADVSTKLTLFGFQIHPIKKTFFDLKKSDARKVVVINGQNIRIVTIHADMETKSELPMLFGFTMSTLMQQMWPSVLF
tara:strand:- start:133 stop:375 length:243 start_codon:yes stop_codon:yes gene_type:complete